MEAKPLQNKLEERLQLVTTIDEQESGKNANIIPLQNSNHIVLSMAPEFVITLSEAKKRIIMLQEFVKDMMVPGQDYGFIPKFDKPTLFKSGAEKLTDIYGLSKHIEVTNRIEDWDKGLFHYEVKAVLINKRTGNIEAEGIGCCNNREKKYATLPPSNVINTILKMAKKRAFIDAVLSATRTSGLFSQDIEDIGDIHESKLSSGKSAELTTPSVRLITKNQINRIQSLVNQKMISIDFVKDLILSRYHVSESKKLTLEQSDDFIRFLMDYKS